MAIPNFGQMMRQHSQVSGGQLATAERKLLEMPKLSSAFHKKRAHY